MVEGIHPVLFEAVRGRPSVPALPDRSRSLGDGEEPARVGRSFEQLVGKVGATEVAQDVKKIRRTEETSLEVAHPLDIFDQVVRGRAAVPWVAEQVEVQREQVRRLGFDVEVTAVIDITSGE